MLPRQGAWVQSLVRELRSHMIPGSTKTNIPANKQTTSPLHWASLVAQLVKNLPAMQETRVWSLDWEDPLEKGKATHSSILVWRIQSMGSQRVRHNWMNFTFTFPLHYIIITQMCVEIYKWELRIRTLKKTESHFLLYNNSQILLFKGLQ